MIAERCLYRPHAEPPQDKIWVGMPPPVCHLCRCPINGVFVDACLDPSQPWACVCPECHEDHGFGLGQGLGQRYEWLFGEWVCTGGMWPADYDPDAADSEDN